MLHTENPGQIAMHAHYSVLAFFFLFAASRASLGLCRDMLHPSFTSGASNASASPSWLPLSLGCSDSEELEAALSFSTPPGNPGRVGLGGGGKGAGGGAGGTSIGFLLEGKLPILRNSCVNGPKSCHKFSINGAATLGNARTLKC